MSEAPVTKRKARQQRTEPPNPLVTRGSKVASESAEVRATVLQEWERFFPWATHVEDLGEKDRKFWIRLREAIVKDHQSFSKLINAVREGIAEELASEIRDREERRGAELALERERTAAALEEKRKRREGREKRKEKRLKQELRERDRFLLLTTIGFAATFVLAIVSAVTQAPVAYAGSGLGLVLSGGSAIGLYRSDRSGGRRKSKRRRKGV